MQVDYVNRTLTVRAPIARRCRVLIRMNTSSPRGRARFGSTFAMDDAGDADVRHHSTAYRLRRHEHHNFPWFQWWFLIRFMILEKSISTSLFYH